MKDVYLHIVGTYTGPTSVVKDKGMMIQVDRVIDDLFENSCIYSAFYNLIMDSRYLFSAF